MLTSLAIDTDIDEQDIVFLGKYYQITADAEWRLTKEDDNFKIIGINVNSDKNSAESLELVIDFRVGKYHHRSISTGKEPLLNALKMKGKLPNCVLDATPGCLKDGFLLASRGIKVIAVERSPIMYFLLNNALQKVNHQLIQPIELHYKDSVEVLQNRVWLDKQLIDLIYLDPIYPNGKKSALVKKEMRITKALVGEDIDADELFMAAKCAKKRIVVKRPPYALPINNEPPSFVSQTGKTRFDVYITN